MVRKMKALFSNGISGVFKPLKVFNRPMHIQLEPTTYCNLSCPSCSRVSFNQKPKHMSFEEFKKAIDIIKPCNITLSGNGEPTLNPDFFKMISYARGKKISIRTTSNFVAVKKEQLESFVSTDVNLLNISVDATKPDTYLKIRTKDAFEKVLENIRTLVAIKKEAKAKHPYIRLAFVVQKDNFKQMIDFFYMAKELGVDAVLFQIFMDPSVANSDLKSQQKLVGGIDMDELEAVVDQLIEISKTEKAPSMNARYLKDNINIMRKLYSGEKMNLVKKCTKPWISLYVTVDGEVRPCCSFGSRPFNMANVLTDDVEKFSVIYNNQKYRRFRKALRKGKVPDPICSICIPESPFDILKRVRWTPGFILPRFRGKKK